MPHPEPAVDSPRGDGHVAVSEKRQGLLPLASCLLPPSLLPPSLLPPSLALPISSDKSPAIIPVAKRSAGVKVARSDNEGFRRIYRTKFDCRRAPLERGSPPPLSALGNFLEKPRIDFGRSAACLF